MTLQGCVKSGGTRDCVSTSRVGRRHPPHYNHRRLAFSRQIRPYSQGTLAPPRRSIPTCRILASVLGHHYICPNFSRKTVPTRNRVGPVSKRVATALVASRDTVGESGHISPRHRVIFTDSSDSDEGLIQCSHLSYIYSPRLANHRRRRTVATNSGRKASSNPVTFPHGSMSHEFAARGGISTLPVKSTIPLSNGRYRHFCVISPSVTYCTLYKVLQLWMAGTVASVERSVAVGRRRADEDTSLDSSPETSKP